MVNIKLGIKKALDTCQFDFLEQDPEAEQQCEHTTPV